MLTPDGFPTVPLPTYPEIPFTFAWPGAVARQIDMERADHVHIATEGPVGWAARHYCLKRGLAFSSAFHTKFPEYVQARIGLRLSLGYALLRRFHAPSGVIMVATRRLMNELSGRGFTRLRLWTRGVDTERYRPRPRKAASRPIFLSVGRVAVEKNLEAFLSLDLPGDKVIVGDGPDLHRLKRKFPDARFLGAKFGDELAAIYAAADVFVFPSLTDTFGLVLLEALASGVPVAAFPADAPREVIGESGAGALDRDLRAACFDALRIPRETARERALAFSWRKSAEQFLENVRWARSREAVSA